MCKCTHIHVHVPRTHTPPLSAHILQPQLPLFSYPDTSSQNMAQTTLINSYMYFMIAPSYLQTQGNESTPDLIKTFTQYGYVVVDPMAGLLHSKF